ncbi:acyl-CoA dehydrogenase family protein [Flavobacterium sp. H122]|uniref:acyl-CoA dehydrogenase family protein n=1 Tax=Flavobacterium sp. H122 TaxID=2529860 RepID=UPI0010AAB11F|nr:acyl-CoA dehydrogenase family protein [Flavobacterium sp. H122]
MIAENLLLESKTVSLSQYNAARELELYLGSPFVAENTLSFQNAAALDEEEIFPKECIKTLHDWGFNHYYIPESLGGKLRSFDELLLLTRVVSRRDLSVAITDAHTLLGSIPVWIGGTDEQKEAQAAAISERKAACLAVTERAHGSDLNASTFMAHKTENGYKVTGEKWPINKATLTDKLCVLARTNEQKSARSLSILLIDKSKTKASEFHHLPKIKTLGIRSCDISGIVFDKAEISSDALIGKEGDGLELTLKGFQITRSLCAGLSLGAVDTALRTTLRLALDRNLYGATVVEIPHARTTLATTFIDILMCDCVAIASARGLHVATKQFSVWSAVAKNYVPIKSEKIFQNLSVILGSRYYFRDNHDSGVFQKMQRDNAIISLFDGSTLINLSALSLQLRFLVTKRKAEKNPDKLFAHLSAIFNLREDLPEFNYSKLDLFSKGNNWVLQGLEPIVNKLDNMSVIPDETTAEIFNEIKKNAFSLLEVLNQLEEKILQLDPIENGHHLPPAYFEVANEYCDIHTAACCLYMWFFNKDHLGDYFSKGEWLVLSLQKTISHLKHTKIELNKNYVENAMIELLRLHENDLLFSCIPFQTNN